MVHYAYCFFNCTDKQLLYNKCVSEDDLKSINTIITSPRWVKMPDQYMKLDKDCNGYIYIYKKKEIGYFVVSDEEYTKKKLYSDDANEVLVGYRQSLYIYSILCIHLNVLIFISIF